MKKFKKLPDKDEYIICTVKNLNPNSAFVSLDEYNDARGMIHISEISSTWVRDIRNEVKIGSKLVAKVLYVDNRTGLVNLSLKRVKPTIKRAKTSEWKNEKKAEKLISIVAKKLKSKEDIYEKPGFLLQEAFGTMYGGLETAAEEGKDALIKAGLDKKWAEAIEEIAKNNIKAKEVSITGIYIIKCFEPDGISLIKKALSIKTESVTIQYISASRYSVKVKANEYPEAEKILEKVKNEIESGLKGKNCEFEFER